MRTGRPVWKERPSPWLAAATAGDLAVIATLVLTGWLIPLAVLAAVDAVVRAGALLADAIKAALFPRLGLHTETPAPSAAAAPTVPCTPDAGAARARNSAFPGD